MTEKTSFVFVHSPLVGVLTWSLVAHYIQQQGYATVLPVLTENAESTDPFWKQHAASVSQAVAYFPASQRLTFVAHSGAGPLLPAIRSMISNPIDAYIFVDAGIARDRASRLDLLKMEARAWAEDFHQELRGGGQFPTWHFEDLAAILPDEALRRQMMAELQPRGLDFFEEPLPVSQGWPDAPCAYIQWSETYAFYAQQARASGWWVKEIPAAHFHMLVDPAAVAEAVLDATEALLHFSNS